MNVVKKNVTLKKKVIINVKLLQSIHRIDSLTVNKTLLIVSFSNSSNSSIILSNPFSRFSRPISTIISPRIGQFYQISSHIHFSNETLQSNRIYRSYSSMQYQFHSQGSHAVALSPRLGITSKWYHSYPFRGATIGPTLVREPT